MARLAEKYEAQIREELKDKFGLKNIFEVPKLEKIVVNIGVNIVVKIVVNIVVNGQNAMKFVKLLLNCRKSRFRFIVMRCNAL